uniref:Uncharacterized protein n=1 Tax=Anopheles atroparvus TaxID=41427 RepID=A0AAG5DGN1_ANOAO
MDNMIMSLEETRRTQRPYRYGMMLLCVGALVNWLGLAENYSEPVRYAGVACILAGACLICTAMCCWLHTPNRPASNGDEIVDPGHVINDERRREKPPDYDTVAIAPPSYDDAIKLDPAALLRLSMAPNMPATSSSYLPSANASASHTQGNGMMNVNDESCRPNPAVDCSVRVIDEKQITEKPPPYQPNPEELTDPRIVSTVSNHLARVD